MARTDTLGNFLTDVADAIRTKKGTTDAIPASNFDTEIVSIEGGDSKQQKFGTIGEGIQTLVNGLYKNVEDYPKLLNEPITLYTPNIIAKYYCIQKRSSGKYRILWFPNEFIKIDATGLYVNYINISTINNTPPSKPNINFSTTFMENGYVTYLSSEMDTINDCINAMRSPNTTYTGNTNNNHGYISDEDYIIPVSNTIIISFNSSNGDYIINPSQQISADETIEVIQ